MAQTNPNKTALDAIQGVSPAAGTDVPPVQEKAVESEKETYKVSPAEKGLYHVRLSLQNSFDPQTGKRIVKPFIQKYNIKMWRNIYDTIKAQGYVVEILHDPTK